MRDVYSLPASLTGSCADTPPPSGPTAADLARPAAIETTDRDVLYVDDFGPDAHGSAEPDCIPSPPPGEIYPTASFPHDQCHDQFLREAIARGLAATRAS